MKILIVTPKYYPDTFPVNLIAERLVKQGHEVDVLTTVPFLNGKYLKKYDVGKRLENGVTVNRVRTHIRKKGTLSLIRNYLSLYKGFKKWAKINDKPYDVTYTYSISPVVALVAGNIVKKKKLTPHFAHVLDLWPESVVATKYTSKHSLLYRILLRWSKKEYQNVSHILVGTKEFEDYLRKVIKVKNIDISYLAQPGLVYEDKNKENPYDINKTNLLYCGNISKLQLVDKFIPMMEKLNNPNVVLNVLGTGSYLEEFKNELKTKNISNIIYHGYFDYKESSKYFKNADAILVTLKNEGIVGKTIPNKLISSLYYAKPIIGVVSSGAKDLLVQNGNIVSDEDVDSIVNSIYQYLKLNKKDVESIINKNRQTYDDIYSLDKFIKNLLSSFSRK
ncbi:MAG: glycosyltransferase family 4 protein [Bacilli bacterium]|nr:glycosyltransferase family 4 protein [Bacilli bacterium]